MSYLEYSEKLESLKYFIKSRSAVTVDDLCNKLNISRRTVLRMIEHLRSKNIDVQYSKKQKEYRILE